MNEMYICVDFDGTIVDHAFPEIGFPVPGAIKWMKRWAEAGAKLILFTMRSDGQKSGTVLSDAVAYLETNGVALHGVNRNPDQASWSTSPKAYAQIYVDDAAFGCPLITFAAFNRPCVDWDVVGPSIEAVLSKRDPK